MYALERSGKAVSYTHLTIVTLSDDKGNPVYKVRGVSEGVAKIKLTSAADENITCVYEVKVIAGVDKSNLQKAIDSYKDLTSEIYTEESYAKFKEAFDNAVAVYNDENATRTQVEQAMNALENAANELEVVLDVYKRQIQYRIMSQLNR